MSVLNKFQQNSGIGKSIRKALGVFFIAAIGGAVALGLNHYYTAHSTIAQQAFSNDTTHQDLLHPENVKYVGIPANSPENMVNFVNAASKSVHAVVHIRTTIESETAEGPTYYDPFRNFFYGPNGQQIQPTPEMASGSGVIISSDGYIVTNNHVIDKAQKIEVTLNDKRTYKAKVIGTDPTTDLALLKIDANNLPSLTYGNSDDVKVGQWVLAVGNPYNLTSTVTAGIVSAKGRNINIIPNDPAKGIYPIEAYIQTDAAVNPGNSGGALVNTAGELVGINSAIASNTGSYTGYSFAVPVNIVKKVVADLLEYGRVQRAFLGVSIQNLTDEMAKKHDITNIQGVYVAGLTKNGAAKGAGIEPGDVITKIGDVAVNKVPELEEQISRFRPGDKVMVTVNRNNKEDVIPVILKNIDGTTALLKKEHTDASSTMLGATFSPLSKDEKQRLSINSGLKIDQLDGGKLRSAGIRQGFIITRIDKKKINSVTDLKDALKDKKGGVLIEGVYPNGMHAYYGFGM